MKKIALSLLFASLFMFSCKKEKETTTPTTVKSATELLTAHKWNITSYTTNNSNAEVKDTLKSWTDSLVKYPISVTYNSNGTYVYSDSSDYGNWKLLDENTIIYNEGTFYGVMGTIKTLTDNNFSVKYMWDVVGDGKIYEVTENAVK